MGIALRGKSVRPEQSDGNEMMFMNAIMMGLSYIKKMGKKGLFSQPYQ